MRDGGGLRVIVTGRLKDLIIVDGTQGVKDPRGMFAETLTASFLVVSAPTAGQRNIVQCVSRSHHPLRA